MPLSFGDGDPVLHNTDAKTATTGEASEVREVTSARGDSPEEYHNQVFFTPPMERSLSMEFFNFNGSDPRTMEENKTGQETSRALRSTNPDAGAPEEDEYNPVTLGLGHNSSISLARSGSDLRTDEEIDHENPMETATTTSRGDRNLAFESFASAMERSSSMSSSFHESKPTLRVTNPDPDASEEEYDCPVPDAPAVERSPIISSALSDSELPAEDKAHEGTELENHSSTETWFFAEEQKLPSTSAMEYAYSNEASNPQHPEKLSAVETPDASYTETSAVYSVSPESDADVENSMEALDHVSTESEGDQAAKVRTEPAMPTRPAPLPPNPVHAASLMYGLPEEGSVVTGHSMSEVPLLTLNNSNDFANNKSGPEGATAQPGASKRLSIASDTYDAGLSDPDIGIIHAANEWLTSGHVKTESLRSVSSIAATGKFPIGSLRLNSDIVEEMDRGTAFQKVPTNKAPGDTHATLVLSDFPRNIMTVGLDAAIFRAPDKIFAIKDIPGGAHFVYAGINELSRSGMWMVCGGENCPRDGEVLAKKWSEPDELIVDEGSMVEGRFKAEELLKTPDRVLSYKAEKDGAIVGFAGGDTDSLLKDIWRRMTFAVEAPTLCRVTSDEYSWKVESNDQAFPDRLYTSLTFLFDKDARMYSSDAIGEERTFQARDTSAFIKRCVGTYSGSEIVAELQFTYLTGMLVGNLRCIEQWVFMVKVLFKAFELPKVAPFLYQRIIETVHSQMIYDKGVLSDSIFEASPNAEDEVKKALTFFKSRMKEYLLEMGHSGELTAEHQGLSKALDDFEAYLWKWGWDLRGSVNRAGKLRLEDGEEVDMDLDDGDDERASSTKGKMGFFQKSKQAVAKAFSSSKPN